MAKTALVTGANRGIGLALARRLKEAGRDVIAVCRKSSRELDALGVRVEADVDITSDNAVAGLPRRLDGVALDELVCNAGVLHADGLDDVKIDDVVAHGGQRSARCASSRRCTAATRRGGRSR
jgi:NAD(P)-dependent dehydrogenase (short-subunit alcohol dehydrogenase family)